jgi:DNA replication protein DnaC
MTTTNDPNPLLKRLRLGYLLDTLPERPTLTRRDLLDYAAFLEIILADEVTRRDNRNMKIHLQQAGFEDVCRLEDFDWSAQVTLDRRLLDTVFSQEFMQRHENVILVGPVGVGKSFLVQAIGYAVLRAGHSVRFIRADAFFKTLAQARLDHPLEKTLRTFLSLDLLILDDFGLQKLTAQQSTDLYEPIFSRYRKSSFAITINGQSKNG